MSARAAVHPITYAVVRNGFLSAAYDMFSVFKRTTMLPLLYEFNDFGMNVYDDRLNMIADAPGLPVFFGSLDLCIERTLEEIGGRENVEPGDVLLNNHPYLTAGQPADAALMFPIFHGSRLIGFSALRAHIGDVGGKNPYPVNSTSMFQEGVIFPGVKLYERGVLNDGILRTIKANSRFPVETAGNVMAAVGALRVCGKKIESIYEKYGGDVYYATIDELLARDERVVREAIAAIPDGTYTYEDYLDDDSTGESRDQPVRLVCTVTVSGSEVLVDLTGSSAELAGAMNCPWGYTVCSCRFALKKITSPETPPSGGAYRPLTVVAPEGTVFNPRPPAPTYLSWATSLRLGDMVVQALAPALPERIPAECGGCIAAVYAVLRNPVTDRWTVWVEDGAIGHGAVDGKDGMNALVHSIVAATELLPAEALEARMPLMKTRSELRQDSGGPGRYRGGLAAVSEFKLTGDGIAIAVTEKSRASTIKGLQGGMGAPDKNTFVFFPGTDGELREGKRADIPLEPGDVVMSRPAGGGGWGDPLERDLDRVWWDVRNEYISRQAAETFYGICFDESGEIDPVATADRRARRAKEKVEATPCGHVERRES